MCIRDSQRAAAFGAIVIILTGGKAAGRAAAAVGVSPLFLQRRPLFRAADPIVFRRPVSGADRLSQGRLVKLRPAALLDPPPQLPGQLIAGAAAGGPGPITLIPAKYRQEKQQQLAIGNKHLKTAVLAAAAAQNGLLYIQLFFSLGNADHQKHLISCTPPKAAA